MGGGMTAGAARARPTLQRRSQKTGEVTDRANLDVGQLQPFAEQPQLLGEAGRDGSRVDVGLSVGRLDEQGPSSHGRRAPSRTARR